MDKKIFIGLAMVVFLVMSIMLITLGVSFLINHAGSIGFIVAPFLALGFGYLAYLILAKLFDRFIKAK